MVDMCVHKTAPARPQSSHLRHSKGPEGGLQKRPGALAGVQWCGFAGGNPLKCVFTHGGEPCCRAVRVRYVRIRPYTRILRVCGHCA